MLVKLRLNPHSGGLSFYLLGLFLLFLFLGKWGVIRYYPPYNGFIIAISRYKCVEWLPWQTADTEYRVLMLARAKLDHRIIRSDPLFKNLTLFVLFSCDRLLIDCLELIFILTLRQNVVSVHCFQLFFIKVDKVVFICWPNTHIVIILLHVLRLAFFFLLSLVVYVLLFVVHLFNI